MAVYKRGGKWWYEFQFRGQRIREAAGPNKALAERAERERRRQLEMGAAGLKEIQQPTIFPIAARRWHAGKSPHWSASNTRIEQTNIGHLQEHFGRLLLSDITAEHVSRYQAERKKAGASPKTINLEVGTLRAILRKHRLWANIQPDVRMLRVRTDVGRALSADEQHRLLTACKASRSRSLYPAVLLAMHTGMRSAELRTMRWRQVDLIDKSVITGAGKTAGGEGRLIPLSETAWRALQEWRSMFPNAEPDHYVFPSERYGMASLKGRAAGKWQLAGQVYSVDPTTPISTWKTSWTHARKLAKVTIRLHDMRHLFVSRLAESQASDATIMSLAGHLSRKMMERYSHVRGEAKRAAVSALDAPYTAEPPVRSPHKSPHSPALPLA